MLCRGCGFPIVDQYLMKVGDAYWHERCVKCSTCGGDLNEKCYLKFGMLHCAEDYFRQYSVHRCFACGHGIGPHDLVYKLKSDIICHLPCQRCFVCGLELGTGARICIDQRTRRLLCVLHADQSAAGGGGEMASMSAIPLGPNQSSNSQPGGGGGARPHFLKTESSSSPISSPPPNCTGRLSYVEMGGGGGSKLISSTSSMRDEGLRQQIIVGGGSGGGSCSSSRYVRRRGPRTTIRPMQLETLNRIFGSTPKPSKQARARLALETGLSMRVIQVWFQNRRSKERRLKHLCNWIRQNEGRGGAVTAGGDPGLLMPSLMSGDLQLTDDDQGSGIEDLLESGEESDSSDKEETDMRQL